VEVIPTRQHSDRPRARRRRIFRGPHRGIYGPESSEKRRSRSPSSRWRRRLGGLAGFIDVEHALDPGGYAKKLGVKLDDLLVSRRTRARKRWRIGETLVRSNAST